jgi:outer membrane protein, multidrug efflux system
MCEGRAAVKTKPHRSVLLFAVLALAACAGGEGRIAPEAELPVAFSASAVHALPARWWLSFEDAELDRLVTLALDGNPSLRATWDRLAQARAVARREGAARGPALDASADASTAWRHPGGDGDSFSIGLAASYELDLWGRIRGAVDAARLDAKGAEADLDAAAITLVASLAGAWYELVEQRGQLALLEQQSAVNEQVLELVTLRFRQGRAGAADVLRQRQLAEQTRGSAEDVRSRIAVLEHQIAVLAGRAPGGLSLSVRADLKPLPPLPSTGLPAELIQRRPDVHSAYLAVGAANGRLAAAIAEQYPRIDLSANLSTVASAPGDLFANWLASLAGQIVGPLVDSGRRAAEVERHRALLSERLNAYEDAVLTALAEVEDALVREARQHDKVASLERQVKLADQVIDRLQNRYTQGATDYIDVLTALSSQQSAARQLLTARRELIGFRIDLARALAGGWALPPPPPRTLAEAERR